MVIAVVKTTPTAAQRVGLGMVGRQAQGPLALRTLGTGIALGAQHCGDEPTASDLDKNWAVFQGLAGSSIRRFWNARTLCHRVSGTVIAICCGDHMRSQEPPGLPVSCVVLKPASFNEPLDFKAPRGREETEPGACLNRSQQRDVTNLMIRRTGFNVTGVVVIDDHHEP